MKHLELLISVMIITAGCAASGENSLKLIGKWHTVKKGETVKSIADKYTVSPDTVAELNDLPKIDPLTV